MNIIAMLLTDCNLNMLFFGPAGGEILFRTNIYFGYLVIHK
jgi:hypothetical protein